MKKFTLLFCTLIALLFVNHAFAGTGTESAPYSIAEAIANQSSQAAWVEGYIVGGIKDDDAITKITDGSEIVWGATNVRATAVFLADDASVTDYTKCVVVNLPTGAIRTAVNLKDNASNIGKKLKVNGTLRAYFSISGVRDLTGYSLGDGGTTPEPQPEDDADFTETFETSKGAFSIVDVTMPDGGSYTWKWETYKYMKASAFIGSAKDSEGWLISPAINLTDKASATLSFEHTGKYFTSSKLTEQEVLVSTDYSSGEPSSATWTSLTIPNWPTCNDWIFVSSGDINLPSVVLGKANVHFAFKYASTTSGAATWEVKNVAVKTTKGTNSIDNSSENELLLNVIGSTLIAQGVEDGTSIEIYNISGAKVQTSVFYGNQIELNRLSKGIYVLHIGKHIQKLIY